MEKDYLKYITNISNNMSPEEIEHLEKNKLLKQCIKSFRSYCAAKTIYDKTEVELGKLEVEMSILIKKKNILTAKEITSKAIRDYYKKNLEEDLSYLEIGVKKLQRS